MREDALSLTRFRNASQPISRLPPELLSEIFTLADSEYGLSYRNYQGFRLSHVCSAWRSVALCTWRLWRSVDLHNLPMSRVLLDRCSGGLIHVSICEGISDYDTHPMSLLYKEMLDPYMQQLQVLTIGQPAM